jgi:DMSO/TMAO reductase YedYZ molybdopterin-dependent catalytic subunit
MDIFQLRPRVFVDRVLEKLPVFSEGFPDVCEWGLRVTGLVRKRLELTLGDLMKLPQVSLTFDFHCLEGWVVPGTEWQGVKASAVVMPASPLPEARYAIFKSGDYTEAFPVESLDQLVVAHSLHGKPLPRENGGPLRLVFSGQKCYQSIKWLEEIELTDRPIQATAREIALARLRQTSFSISSAGISGVSIPLRISILSPRQITARKIV